MIMLTPERPKNEVVAIGMRLYDMHGNMWNGAGTGMEIIRGGRRQTQQAHFLSQGVYFVVIYIVVGVLWRDMLALVQTFVPVGYHRKLAPRASVLSETRSERSRPHTEQIRVHATVSVTST